ncbi:MAG: hypothetical protein MJ162_00075 [Treponema sp.]|nr:hypothetical protein [Treponema sp.]
MFRFIKSLSPVARRYLVLVGEVLFIVGITLFALCPFSCRVSAEGIKVIGGDYVPPVLESFTVINENTLRLVFSEKVSINGSIISLVADPFLASSEKHSVTEELSPSLAVAAGLSSPKIIESLVEYSGDGKIVTFRLLDGTEIGEMYELYGVVSDCIGNTLTFAVPFYGFNSRVPRIIMTEIQSVSVSSQNSKEKLSDTYRNEFVEFLALSDGNLCGLELLSGYDGEEKKFVFPRVEVKAGEVFVVHMRNRGNGCISELGDELNLAYSSYTSDTVRDLWSDISSTTIGNKTDVLIIRNQADNSVIDAVMYHDDGVNGWSKNMPEYALMAVDAGIYENDLIESGSLVSDKSDTKTISRINAKELQEKVLKGINVEFPVKVNSESWIVSSENAGTL